MPSQFSDMANLCSFVRCITTKVEEKAHVNTFSFYKIYKLTNKIVPAALNAPFLSKTLACCLNFDNSLIFAHFELYNHQCWGKKAYICQRDMIYDTMEK